MPIYFQTDVSFSDLYMNDNVWYAFPDSEDQKGGADVIRELRASSTSISIRVCKSFYEGGEWDDYDYDKKVDWLVTNPPYSDFNRFLEHSFDLADNLVILVPVAKLFKSIGTLSSIFDYGGFVEIHTLPSSKAGFPFGFPSAVYYMKRGYKGDTKIKMLDGIIFKKKFKPKKEVLKDFFIDFYNKKY